MTRSVQCLLALLLCAPLHAHVGALVVPAEIPTLQQALDVVQDGGGVELEAGVFVATTLMHPIDGLSAGPRLHDRVDVRIHGAGPGRTIIDVGDHHHGFLISGVNVSLHLIGLTIRGSGASLFHAEANVYNITFENVVFEARPGVQAAVRATNGGHEFTSCTFAGDGTALALDLQSAATIVRNSAFAGFAAFSSDAAQTAEFSAFFQVASGLPAGAGNFIADPLFADPVAGDFHLRSTRGRISGSLIVVDLISSPLIDAADPFTAIGAETYPHGGRRNIGAFGGTAEASLSPGVCRMLNCGDCDQNGTADVLDALLAAQISSGIVLPMPSGSDRFDSCNVSGQATPDPAASIDVLDALRIALFAVGSAQLNCCVSAP